MLLLLIAISSCSALYSIVVSCDDCSHTTQTHSCCSCENHIADCETHTTSLGHICKNSSFEGLVYILPATNNNQQHIHHHIQNILDKLGVLLSLNLKFSSSHDTTLSRLWWLRDEYVVGEYTPIASLLRAPPTLL